MISDGFRRRAGEARLQNASLQQIEADPELQAYAMQVGQSVFGDNCATCHGANGDGKGGYLVSQTLAVFHMLEAWRSRWCWRPTAFTTDWRTRSLC